MTRPSQRLSLSTLLVPCLILSPAAVLADVVKTKCPDIEKCAQAVSELTGERYIYDSFVSESSSRATENFELTKENANEVLTLMLNRESYTRVPLSESGTFTIMRQREARDSALPLLLADGKTTPDFPKTWDLATLRYKLNQPELASQICLNMRSFLPANSRIVPDEMAGQIIVVAQIPILASSLRTIRSMDVKEGAENMKRARDSERRAAAEAPPPKPPRH